MGDEHHGKCAEIEARAAHVLIKLGKSPGWTVLVTFPWNFF